MLSKIILLFSLCTMACISTSTSETKLIIDTDAGADDAVAILLALSVPEQVKVMAITCTYGNTWVTNVETNVLKILTFANRNDIPVYSGAKKPFIRDYNATDIFGEGGCGDCNFTSKIHISIDRSKHAALAMISLVEQHPGEITIICLGPPTNVALAATLEPNFSRNVKRFYVMGSSPLRVGFNFALDPESTITLLDSITTVTKLIISSSAVPFEEMLSKDWRLNVLGKLDSERVQFINNVESVVLKRLEYWPASDSIAMSMILWPELVTDSIVGRMSSDKCDSIPGSVKLEHNGDHNVELVTGFNVTAFAEKLLEHLAASSSKTKADKTKLIIDTDAGGDDAVAILLALAVPEKVNVVTIICSYGNTWVNNVEKNVLKTLTIANRSDIPVYSGAEKPLFRDYAATDYFGQDGFGDFDFMKEIKISIDRSKHGALAIIDMVKQHPGEISILSMGPTTNVALAASLDSTFSQNVKRFYVMRSKPYEPSGKEFNFGLDPESNAILLNSKAWVTKLISTGHIAADYKISKSWRTDVFGKLNNERVAFLNNAKSAVLERLNEWQAADSIALSTVIWPELVIESEEARMISDTCSETQGAVKLVADGEMNVEIIQAFDVEGFKEKLLQHFA